MEDLEIMAILERAALRARAEGKPYAGHLTPLECHLLLQHMPNSRLVDVRTQPELEFVGFVPGHLHVQWQIYPEMQVNPRFAEELSALVHPDDHLFFLCRTGGRSAAAAAWMCERGFVHCYNVLEGFEGNKDADGRRGIREGWKAAGLPWQHK